MKKILAVMLSVAALVSASSAAMAASYTDVPENAWYTGYVNKISELKGFAGYEDNTFRPDNQITQEEFVKTVVALTVGEQPEATRIQSLSVLGRTVGTAGLSRILIRLWKWDL